MRRIDDGKVEALRRVELLRTLRSGDLTAIARTAEVLDVEAGAVLEAIGQRPARWWVVLDGLVVLDAPDATVLAGRGDTWGAAEALTRRPAAATATAFERASVLVVDGPRLAPLLHAVPDVAIELLRR